MEEKRTFTTNNRLLEQFLWMHKITFINQFKMDDGMNAWVYLRTPKFEYAYSEYVRLKNEPFTA